MESSEHNYIYKQIRSKKEETEKLDIPNDPTKRTRGPIKKGKGGKFKKW